NAYTPCPPGLRPVIREDHAGSVSGGIVERSGPHVPRCMSAARRGRRPALAQGLKSCHVAPSSPMTRTFGMGGEKARHSTDRALAGQARRRTRWVVPACLLLVRVAHAAA